MAIASLTSNTNMVQPTAIAPPVEEINYPETASLPSLPVAKEVVKPERNLCRLASNNAATHSNCPSTRLRNKGEKYGTIQIVNLILTLRS